MSLRNYSWADHLIEQFDLALRTACRVDTPIGRARPEGSSSLAAGSNDETTLATRLMRINHTGEVCAQALYQGQALTAKTPALRDHLWQAARDESDHLAWCASRVHELDGKTSVLNPAFYIGAFTLGAVAGIAGDRWSLGFVAETEKQVADHLQDHLERLPPADGTSRAIVEQMKADEERHGSEALAAGGKELPTPIRGLMRLASKVMTTTTYWI